jgi:hypothetical protein
MGRSSLSRWPNLASHGHEVAVTGQKQALLEGRSPSGTLTQRVPGDHPYRPLSIRVFARLKSAAQDDGADIHNVVFQVDGGDIYERTENNAAYCMFGGGDDKTEQSCDVWSFADHGNRWPNNGAELDAGGSYTVRIFVRAKDDTKVADWNFRLEVRP